MYMYTCMYTLCLGGLVSGYVYMYFVYWGQVYSKSVDKYMYMYVCIQYVWVVKSVYTVCVWEVWLGAWSGT